MYRLDESLKNDSDVYAHKNKCKVDLSIADTDTEAFDKARNILDTIRFKKVEP